MMPLKEVLSMVLTKKFLLPVRPERQKPLVSIRVREVVVAPVPETLNIVACGVVESVVPVAPPPGG